MYDNPPDKFKEHLQEVHFIYSHHSKERQYRFKQIGIWPAQIKIDITRNLETMQFDTSMTWVRIIWKWGIYVISREGMIITMYVRSKVWEEEYKDQMKYRKVKPSEKVVVWNRWRMESRYRFYNQDSKLWKNLKSKYMSVRLAYD